jgi:hypothetical protein
MMKPELLDVVALKEPIPEHDLEQGRVGTVVELLPPDHFEVEFVRKDGSTEAMLALSGRQLLVLHYERQLVA